MITPLDLVPEIQASNGPSAGTWSYNSTQTFNMQGKPNDNDSDKD